ncbi:transporter [Novosphingobium sp. ST904]|nr:transporter [Novosphingobium sp. ST904]
MAGGCAQAVRTSYSQPALPVDAAWDYAAQGADRLSSVPWWNEFNDPGLTSLVDRVLVANADLAAAGLRLKKAHLAAEQARQGLFPSGNASLSSNASKLLNGGSPWSKSSAASLGVSWELDLFGRLSAAADAAKWEDQASAQDLAETRLSLISTTAQAWWQLGLANEQITIGEESLSYVRRALELVRRQYDAGAVSRLELRDAEQSVAAQESSQTQLIQARVQALKALAALLDRQSYDGAELRELPHQPLPAIAAGVPASLLGRRPDLAAAELRLRGTLASSDATVASYYPSLSLTGTLGTASSSLLKFFSDPAAGIGAMLSLPELNPAKVRLATGIARTDYDIAVQNFRQTFYDALRDTQTVLSAREQYVHQAGFAEDNYAAARDAERLYERQYRAGAIPLRSWLDAQERLRSARTSLIQNRFNQLVTQVQVYQALGGDAAQT